MSERYPWFEAASAAEWRGWLEEHHADEPGVWLVTFKQGRGPSLPYAASVEEALCFGWVDSVRRRIDEDRSRLLMTPRKLASRWSGANKERVARLEADGRMTDAGRRLVTLAKETGTWTALDAIERQEEPDDLVAALDATAGAREHWDGFPPSARRGILDWISTAKTASTRAKRIAETASEAAAGRRANQWRPKG